MVVLKDTLKESSMFSKGLSALSSSTFAEFKRVFKGDLVTPTDASYLDAIKRWAANAVRRALIVAFVRDAEDISLAVTFARSTGLPIAVRGGGHNPGGSSSSENGLVVDLSRYMNECRVDADKRLAYVGGGAIWQTVDEAAVKHGLATVGGTVNHTGVGGLTLGGGYGWLSSLHGLAIDNVVKATVVTADGSILTASEDQNRDLFWAIRGGGCNFGVVSEFVFRLHRQRSTVYSGVMIFPPPLVDQVMQVTYEWWKSNPGPRSSLLHVVTRGPAPDYAPCIVIIPFFNGTVREGRNEFKAFLDLNPVDMTGETPYEKVNGLQNPNVQHGRRVYMRGVTQLEYTPAVTKRAFERMCELSDADMRITMIFELFPLAKINSKSNDATAFNLRGPANNVLCMSIWDEDSPEFADRGYAGCHAMTKAISDAELKPETSITRAYGNYVGDERLESDKSRKVFGENYPRLQSIKKKYDPEMVFSKWFAIVPA